MANHTPSTTCTPTPPSRTLHPPFPSAAARPLGTPLPPGLPAGIPPALELDILIEDLTYPRITLRELAINHRISLDLLADLLECDYVQKRVERLKSLALWRARFISAAAAPAAAEQLSLIVYDDDARFETRRRAASHILRLAVERVIPSSQPLNVPQSAIDSESDSSATPVHRAPSDPVAAASGGHVTPATIDTRTQDAVTAAPNGRDERAATDTFTSGTPTPFPDNHALSPIPHGIPASDAHPQPSPGRLARTENTADRRTQPANPRPEAASFTYKPTPARGGGSRTDRKPRPRSPVARTSSPARAPSLPAAPAGRAADSS